MRHLLQTDAEAAYNGDPAALSKEEVIVAYPFMEAISVHRLAHESHSTENALRSAGERPSLRAVSLIGHQRIFLSLPFGMRHQGWCRRSCELRFHR